MSDAHTTDITASCHCKSHSFTVTVPTSSLPLKTHACHCTSCRHCTGTLYATAGPWPSLPENHTLERYDFTEKTQVLFCGKCSQKMFWFQPEKSTYNVITACLPHDKGLVQYRHHIFVEDTKDGGISTWMMNPHPETAVHHMPIPRWKGSEYQSEKIPADWPAQAGLSDEYDLTTHGDELPLRCHCGGVDLKVSRPDYTKSDESEVPWLVDPISRRKWLAIMCVCNDCRLTFSADVVPLAYVELKHIHFGSSGPLGFPKSVTELSEAVARGDPSMGTLTEYKSSAKASRYHCKRCSASVFYANNSAVGPDVVDLAVGLIDSPDGARAEGMVYWPFITGFNGSFYQVAKDGWRGEIARSFRTERQAWREARGWRVDQQADQATKAEAEKTGDMLI